MPHGLRTRDDHIPRKGESVTPSGPYDRTGRRSTRRHIDSISLSRRQYAGVSHLIHLRAPGQ